MRVDDQMAAWLADDERQRTGLRDAVDIARKWLSGPFVERIRSDMGALPKRSASAVARLAEGWVVAVPPVAELVETLTRGSLADPFFRPVFVPFFSEVSSGLMLYDEPGLAVSLAVTNPDALGAKKVGRTGGASINFTGYQGVYHFIRAGGATFSFWETPDDTDADAECRFVGRRVLRDGEILKTDGCRESFVIEHLAAPMVYLHAVIADENAPIAREYDSATRRRIGVSGNDESAARVEMMTSLLRVLDRPDAAPVFDKLIEGSSFHMRWHIMREMLALDAEAALPTLRRLADTDPHAEVRQAARATLDKFFPQAGEAA